MTKDEVDVLRYIMQLLILTLRSYTEYRLQYLENEIEGKHTKKVIYELKGKAEELNELIGFLESLEKIAIHGGDE